jgi:hypothetical protein
VRQDAGDEAAAAAQDPQTIGESVPDDHVGHPGLDTLGCEEIGEAEGPGRLLGILPVEDLVEPFSCDANQEEIHGVGFRPGGQEALDTRPHHRIEVDGGLQRGVGDERANVVVARLASRGAGEVRVARELPDLGSQSRCPLAMKEIHWAAPLGSLCTFGGLQLDELFITTSRSGLGPADEPRAGALFRVALGIRGLPTRTYAG